MHEPQAAYLTLKLAQKLFSKSPDGLSPEERRKVDTVAKRQRELENLILSTPEAAQVMLPDSSIDANIMEIRARYGNDGEYHADLERIGLTPDSLRPEIERDLIVDTVLERVASRAAVVSTTDVEIFYFMHKDRFSRPEVRTLRHILITINDSMPGSERDAALAKSLAIHARLIKDPKRFEEQAFKHSECPTAMEGGLLGQVTPGKLFAELEPTAFALGEGELSAPTESPLGYHLLRCDRIEPGRTATLAESRESILQHLTNQRRQICQKSWINSLRRSAP